MPQPSPLNRPTTLPSRSPDDPAFRAVCRALTDGTRFLITSHARPDGDSIGSQLALAYALDALGKQVRIVNADPPPLALRGLPGIDRIEVAASVEGTYDAVVTLECGDLRRPGLQGLERYPILNIDHHAGNTAYGRVNWFDATAAACAELVVDVIDALALPFTREMAAHVYVAILTDTGGFHHSNITTRTFDICRRAVDAGIDPAALAQQVYDSASVGRLRLLGLLLDGMRLELEGRLALMYYDDELLASAGATYDDTEGLINVPLSAQTIEAVALLKGQAASADLRVSLRSKGNIDVRAVAQRYGGGGHTNAAGCSLPGPRPVAEAALLAALGEVMTAGPAPAS
jgi:phosphoesterase RecJ-like protein